MQETWVQSPGWEDPMEKEMPVQGTKIPCAMWSGQKKRMENASSRYKR